MRLRLRLSLVLLLVNAAVLGALAFWAWQDESQSTADMHRRRAHLEKQVRESFTKRFDPSRAGDIPAMLNWPLWEEFEEAVLIDRRMLNLDGVVVPVGAVLNPKGSRHRLPDFPLSEVFQALEKAALHMETVEVAGGLAMPLVTRAPFSEERTVWGGVFVKLPPLPMGIPLWLRVLLVAGGATLFGAGLLFFFLGRAIVQPLEGLAKAIQDFGDGKSPCLPTTASSQEMDSLHEAFQSMMTQIQGFQQEMKEQVEQATGRASLAERRAAQRERLAAMGTLAAGLAHEINSPLAGALQGLETLRAEVRSERAQMHGGLTQEALERIRDLVQQLLRLAPSRVEAGQCSLETVFQNLQVFLGKRLPPHRLVLDLPKNLPKVLGSEGDLFPVFLNLLQNAVDALDQHGQAAGLIRLSAQWSPESKEIFCYVEDNGPGVEPSLLSHIFEPFVTNKDVGQGTGLGLALAHATIGQLGGSIEAQNQSEGGLRITIRLPLAEEG